MYFGNLVAGVFAPTVFLHFCLAFPSGEARSAAPEGRPGVPAGGLLSGRLLGQSPPAGADLDPIRRAELAAGPGVAGLPDRDVLLGGVVTDPGLPERRGPVVRNSGENGCARGRVLGWFRLRCST